MFKSTITERCAEFVTDLNYSEIDKNTIQITKRCVLDWLGCAISGSNTAEGKNFLRFVSSQPNGNRRSSMMGTDLKTSPLFSLLINGYNSHILEMG